MDPKSSPTSQELLRALSGPQPAEVLRPSSALDLGKMLGLQETPRSSPLNLPPPPEPLSPQSQQSPSEQPSIIRQFRQTHDWINRKVFDRRTGGINQPNFRRALQKMRKNILAVAGSESPILQRYKSVSSGLKKIEETDFKELWGEFQHIVLRLESIAGVPHASWGVDVSPSFMGAKVLIIHGHDENNTLRLKDLLQNEFKLQPVLMQNNPGNSRALKEKFEQVASGCVYAFALITPDDVVSNKKEEYNQARPNVTFELGWFTGRLGIQRVCMILKRGTRIHSDLDGISRIEFREDVKEEFLAICKELKEAGLAPATAT